MKTALALTLATTFLLTTLPALRAGTIEFPKDDPSFRVTLPGGWKTTTDENGSIKFAANDSTRLVTRIRQQTSIHTDDELKAFLVKMAHQIAEKMKLTDVKVSEISQTTTPNKIMLFELKATGTTPDGTEAIFPFAGFAPKKGTYFLISAAAPAGVYKAHQKEHAEVINAIAPLP